MEPSNLNPYEAPASLEQPSQSLAVNAYQFREMKVFAWLAAAMIALHIPYAVFVILLQMEILASSIEVAELVDLLKVGCMIAAIVFFCIWKYRCACNARFFYGGPLVHSPGWCVGSYFIPILMLFRPYQGMKEIYQKTYQIFNQSAPISLVLIWWWVWIIRNISENASTNDKNGSIIMFSSCLTIVSCALAILVIYTLTRRQYEIVSDDALAKKIGTMNPLNQPHVLPLRGVPVKRPQAPTPTPSVDP